MRTRAPAVPAVSFMWEGLEEAQLERRWRVPAVRAYGEIGSTNDVARRLADNGAVSGTVVIADRQTAGRGRAGRTWAADAGQSLLVSIVAPALPADRAAVLPLHVGLALAEAIDPFGRVPAMVKWPNDVLIDGRKCAGILCEQSWMGERNGPVIVGVGLNVLQSIDDLPEAIRPTATSISMGSSNASLTRMAVADAVVPAVVAAVCSPASEMGEVAGLSDRLRARDALLGRSVMVTDASGGTPLTGVVMGIAPDGALLLRVDGTLRKVRAGTVRPVDGRFRLFEEHVG